MTKTSDTIGIRQEIEKLLYEFDPGGYVKETDLAKWEALITRERKRAVEEAFDLGHKIAATKQYPKGEEGFTQWNSEIISEMFPSPPC